MNYQKIYNQLIERGKIRNLTNRKETYFERHHIIPKCLGGSNEDSNLVNLTAREHFLAHWLLHRIYPTNAKLSYAFFRLAFPNNGKERNFTPSSRSYEEARKCQIFTKERCKKMSDTKIRKFASGEKVVWNKGKKNCFSKKSKQKRLDTLEKNGTKLNCVSKKANKKRSKSLLGKKSKKIVQFDLNFNFISNFSSITEASLLTNISVGSIHKSCNKLIPVCSFIFKYKDAA